MSRTTSLPIGSFDALECRGDSLYIKGEFTDLSPYGEPMEVGICSPGTTLWHKQPNGRYKMVGFAMPSEQTATQPRPQPPAQSTDWACPGCGKVNLREQRACGAGEWDGCGGPRVEEADGDDGVLLTIENMTGMEMPPMPDVFVNGIRIPGTMMADRVWCAPDINITTMGKHAREWLDLMENEGDSSFRIVFPKWEEYVFRGYVKSYRPTGLVIVTPTTEPRCTRFDAVPRKAKAASTRNYYQEITGAESMQEQFEEIVEKVLGEHGKGERQLEHEAAAYFASPITETWDVVKDCIISAIDKIAGF